MNKGTGDTHSLESWLLSHSRVLYFEKCSLWILGPQLVMLCGNVIEALKHGGLEQDKRLSLKQLAGLPKKQGLIPSPDMMACVV